MLNNPESNKFYITTTLPYVNAEPHIGFALEIIQADSIARYHALQGEQVIFNTGTDEHGIKVYRRALGENKDPQVYVNELAEKFRQLKGVLNLSYTHFIQTSDPRHKCAAQEFWKLCRTNGDIYKKNYRLKYCVGCELEKTESELENNHCPIHPNLELEIIEEENYFFRFSKYQKPLLKFYEGNPDFVTPTFRLKEIKKFVESGLQDFSISRLKEKLPWGVEVPDDPQQIVYVWFDALINYISTLDWPEKLDNFNNFWPGVQIAGKDNLRQQAAMWQAMLMSARLPNSRQILIHGFITVEGQKMSKSLGNVVDPVELVRKYGADPVRYYLLREIPTGEDGDFSYKKFEDRYNGDLANGLGNLVARVAALGEKISPIQGGEKEIESGVKKEIEQARDNYEKGFADFRLNEALASVWELISFADKYINDAKPWKEKDGGKLSGVIFNASYLIDKIRHLLIPFLPETAEKIKAQVSLEDSVVRIKKGESLFPRLS